MTDLTANNVARVRITGEEVAQSRRVLCLPDRARLRKVDNTVRQSRLNFCAAVLLGLVVVGWCEKGETQTNPADTVEANAAMIRKAYDAFSRGDIESVFATFDQNILWH